MLYKNYIYLYNFFFNYPTPANLTNVWNFGVLSFVFLLIQIVSGIGLSMYYVPNEEFAFIFVEYIMRDTYFGWFFRYVHSNGASLFFFFVYLHFFRSLFYFSYVHPKIAIWNTGVVILLLMIITAFTGYVLPWGQMSFWACTVITNLASAFPFVGEEFVKVIWGSYGVTTQTLNRFYTVHFILPFVILIIMIAHFYYLHSIGSSNGTQIFEIEDKMKFHPYYTWKDAVVVVSVISLYIFIIATTPNYLSHADNYIPANAMVTPEHIIPEWYFLAFYAMLRSIPTKLGGILVLICSITILLAFPFHVKSFYNAKMWHRAKCEGFEVWSVKFFALVTKRTNPLLMRYLFWIFAANFVGLSYIGMQPVEKPYLFFGGLFTFIYFMFFYSSLYIHSFNFWVIRVKGLYLPHMLFTLKALVWGLKYVNSKFNKYFKFFFPNVYKLYVYYIQRTIDFFFKYIISQKNFANAAKKLNDMLDTVDNWQYLFNNGKLEK